MDRVDIHWKYSTLFCRKKHCTLRFQMMILQYCEEECEMFFILKLYTSNHHLTSPYE